jgi:hypothetical protein
MYLTLAFSETHLDARFLRLRSGDKIYQKKTSLFFHDCAMIPVSALPNRTFAEGVHAMFSFLIGFAFVAMVVGPPILATIQRSKSREDDI